MNNPSNFPLRLPAVKVQQTLGSFFAVAIPARILRQIVFLDPTRIASVDRSNFLYKLLGSQRDSSGPRTRSIAKYINTVESAFPNSIILSANYNDQGSLIENGDDGREKRWKIEEDSGMNFLVIPSSEKMASVIDGQHRLLGFDYCNEDRKDMELLCSVYLDLPVAYQAYLFATININQRKVDKSLAYEQFGYNLDEESAQSWAPDKLAVFFTRKLNLNPNSPLCNHIKIAPLDSDLIFSLFDEPAWKISTACVVEGILSLFSSRPMSDRDILHNVPINSRHRRKLPDDNSPLRDLFRACEDDKLWGTILEFLKIAQTELWHQASSKSYIRKTIGVQALFEVFRFVAMRFKGDEMLSKLREVFRASGSIDFSDSFFQASGKGKVRVKNTILLRAKLIHASDLPDGDHPDYVRMAEI